MDNMGDRAGRAARRAACAKNIVLEDADSSSGNQSLEEVVRAPLERVRPPAVVAPLAMDPGMWSLMVA